MLQRLTKLKIGDDMEIAPPGQITMQVAKWAARTEYSDIPERAIHAAKRSILDAVGVASAGAGDAAVEIAIASYVSLMPANSVGDTPIIGRSLRLDKASATLINGISGHILDFDDTMPTRLHVSATMLPPLLAIAAERKSSGRDLLTAFAVGVEVMARATLATFPDCTLLGWHGTGIMGTVGVAGGVGNMIRLDEKQMANAFGIAATQAAGLRLSFGTMSKSLNLGRAGVNGLVAASLASHGFTGGLGTFDEAGGFLELFRTDADADVMRDGLGQTWKLDQNGFKPYPSGFVTHAAIDGAIALRHAAESILPHEVQRIVITVPPETLVLTGKTNPRTGLEGKFSVFHAVAAAYLDGDISLKSFSDAAVLDSQTRALAGRVEAIVDASLSPDAATVEIVSASGSRRIDVPHARGSSENPLTDEELIEKFDRLVEPVYASRTARIKNLIWNLENTTAADLIEVLDLTEAVAD